MESDYRKGIHQENEQQGKADWQGLQTVADHQGKGKKVMVDHRERGMALDYQKQKNGC